MHKGQVVKIIDGSYMTTIIKNDISRYGSFPSTHAIGLNKDLWIIVETNGSYPARGFLNKNRRNNTIIQNNSNGEIWFCDIHLNIEPFKKSIPELTMKEAIKKIGFEFKIIN